MERTHSDGEIIDTDHQLVPVGDQRVGGIAVSGPADVTAKASAVADQLRDVISKQGLCVKIKGREHVLCEGWTTAAALMGIGSRERDVVLREDGTYVAYVELIRWSDGIVVGGASAECGPTEGRWARAEAFQRRSMAITRATAKACRLSFSWIVSLAGYNPTPAEEMEGVEPDQASVKPQAEAKPVSRPGPPLVQRFYERLQELGDQGDVPAIEKAIEKIKSDERLSSPQRDELLVEAYLQVGDADAASDILTDLKIAQVRKDLYDQRVWAIISKRRQDETVEQAQEAFGG